MFYPSQRASLGGMQRNAHHVVSQRGISFTTATETSEGIEHARTHEADKGDHAKLNARRGIPGESLSKEAESSIFPSTGEINVGVIMVVSLS